MSLVDQDHFPTAQLDSLAENRLNAGTDDVLGTLTRLQPSRVNPDFDVRNQDLNLLGVLDDQFLPMLQDNNTSPKLNRLTADYGNQK